MICLYLHVHPGTPSFHLSVVAGKSAIIMVTSNAYESGVHLEPTACDDNWLVMITTMGRSSKDTTEQSRQNRPKVMPSKVTEAKQKAGTHVRRGVGGYGCNGMNLFAPRGCRK